MSIENHGLVVLTVAYHSHQALENLALDLARQRKPPKQWLVVNNSPNSEGPLKLDVPFDLFIIEGSEGDGFSQGCNAGLEQLQFQGWEGWVWLLNPDIALVEPDTIQCLELQLASVSEMAVVGTAVLDEKGSLESSAGWIDLGLDFRRRRVNQRLLEAVEISPMAVDWLSGCSLMLRPSVHKTPPRFEPLLPLYYEDMDLCIRHSQLGHPVLWLPFINVSHQRGQGSNVPTTRRIRLSTCSYIRFLQRHRPGWVLFVRAMRLLLNSLLRMPLTPRLSFAVFTGFSEALKKPLV